MTERVLHNARVVAEGAILDPGWIVVDAGHIREVGCGSDIPPSRDVVDLNGSWVFPGFVDVHSHGAAGSSFYSGNSDDVRRAAASHLAHGTTGMLASIGSTDFDAMLAAARAIATVIDDGSAPNLLGIHFEGPFLSPARRGAQTPSALLLPSEDAYEKLVAAAGGHAKSMTIAPELEGARALIRAHSGEIKFFIGHSDAAADVITAAIDDGATGVTHLFNAMPPLHHRNPGPVARVLLDDRVICELIVDGHHVADDAILLALRAAGSGRLVLVTDSMPAAGLGDGRYTFVDRTVDVLSGKAVLSTTGAIAGSAIFISDAVARMTDRLGVGAIPVALMASTNAADAFGWTDRGAIQAGRRADLVILDDAWTVTAVMNGGEFV